jgi:hypothetical protein
VSAGSVEVVRGRVDEELAVAIADFWVQRGLLAPEAARERLGQVVCVLRGSRGEVLGVNSAHAANVPMVGGRLFWNYRAALGEGTGDEEFFAMLGACFDTLADEFAAAAVGPVGLCVLVDDVAMLERNPEAIWPGVGFLHAGFAPDGAQLRLRYFEDARI